MSDSNTPELPEAPTFQFGPGVQQNIGLLTDIGANLTSGDFPEFLKPLTELNPEFTQQAINLATRSVERVRGTAQQDIINQLEANNQLTSSVAVNRLSELNEEFSRDVSDISTRFALADVERAFTNRLNLFNTGVGAAQAGGQLGLTSQFQQNQFALTNFENELALSQLRGQNSGQGGTIGGLVGGGIGAFAGGPVGFGIGSAIGGGIGELVSPSSTGAAGGAFISGGLGLLGGQQPSQEPIPPFLSEFSKIQQGRKNIGFGVSGLAGSIA